VNGSRHPAISNPRQDLPSTPEGSDIGHSAVERKPSSLRGSDERPMRGQQKRTTPLLRKIEG
jgi:hypothetical protein